jgi:uncharacterized protein (DUF1501 family)
MSYLNFPCGGSEHLNRRSLLRATALLGGASWMTAVAERLARAQESAPRDQQPMSLIVLWLAGGPSQMETFDPHYDEAVAKGEEGVGGQVNSIKTRASGIEIGEGLPLLAEQMDKVALIRSVVSKEGDHERATYNVKNGYRMDPTLIHPSLGSILCHETQDNVEIPRHISIIPNQWPARGGYLGDQFDAFKTFDPIGPIPDVVARVDADRVARRRADLDVVENVFAKRRRKQLEEGKTLHRASVDAALRMMDSEHLAAFDVKQAPQAMREEFGETAFGRSCLAALRLIEVGVRCVEVTLDGFDSHANNLEVQKARLKDLDPAFSALLKHLEDRKLLGRTLVVCGGEFGRTPRINPLKGRDHWPHGFSIALAGANIRGGKVVGETAAKPVLDEKDKLKDVSDPRTVEDVHATILTALGLDPKKELQTPISRPLALSPTGGKVIGEILNT